MAPLNKDDCFKAMEEQLQKNKIITFKSLSRTLNIHSTITKRLMKEFIETKSEEKYHVTFLIFGKTETGEFVIVFSEGNESPEENNVTVIEKHIYSIEFTSSDFDFDEIYNLDKTTFELEKLNLSSIKYPGEIIRKKNVTRSEEVAKTESTPSPVVSKEEPTNVTCTKPISTNSNNLNESSKDKKETIKTENTKKTNKSKNEICKKPVPIFFQKKNPPDDDVEKKKLRNVPKETVLSSEKKEKEGSPDSRTKSVKESNKKNEKEVVEPSSKKIKVESTESVPKKNNRGKNKTSKKSNSKGNKNKKTFKKITLLSDSSSESETNEDDVFDNLPEEPEYVPEPPSQNENVSLSCVSQGRKRKRKVVEKNLMDEDGFLLTKKEIVYESCSDDNDENVPNDNLDSEKRLKTSNSEPAINFEVQKKVLTSENDSTKNRNTKVKQSSIMNFFKKS